MSSRDWTKFSSDFISTEYTLTSLHVRNICCVAWLLLMMWEERDVSICPIVHSNQVSIVLRKTQGRIDDGDRIRQHMLNGRETCVYIGLRIRGEFYWYKNSKLSKLYAHWKSDSSMKIDQFFTLMRISSLE